MESVPCGHSGPQANRGSAIHNTELPELPWASPSTQQMGEEKECCLRGFCGLWVRPENGVIIFTGIHLAKT